MARFRWAALVALGIGMSGGCDQIPGTPWHDMRLARQAVAGEMRDPAAAQFRNVRLEHRRGLTVVCGEANGRNGFGAYAGFQRFVVELPALHVQSDPLITTTADEAATTLRQCETGGGYMCEAAQRQSQERLLQGLFESYYGLMCGAGPSPAATNAAR